MRTACIIFPHQLFADAVERFRGGRVVLIEHPLYFTQFPFHKQKLILHRASMKAFAAELQRVGINITYIDSDQFLGLSTLSEQLQREGVEEVFFYEVVDDWLSREINESFHSVTSLVELSTPMFLTPPDEIEGSLGGHKQFRMADFYVFQRRRLDILVDKKGRPAGGRWSFDDENRKRLPMNHAAPAWPKLQPSPFVTDACDWVEKHFPDNYGSSNHFRYPTTHSEAKEHLTFFLNNALAGFGDYEDAMSKSNSRLFHSVLTSSLNTGLITPQEVIESTLEYTERHPVPLNSLEGFVRQIIGWREYMRGVYHVAGRQQRSQNFFKFHNPVPAALWSGTTGLEPADHVIQQVLATGYAHHIERLMVLGNLLLLCEIHPDAVYEWFMTLFIDAYDWVMVPNVYGMSQYADGGRMTTKPYTCGSAYLRKMGDWNKGDWTDTWDGLYWRFIDRHRGVFAGNQRVGLAPASLDNMDPARRQRIFTSAETFLSCLMR